MSKQALAKEIGLETARTAVGADRRLVGHQQRHVDVDVRDPIRPRHELRDVARADGAVGAHIGAHVDEGVAAQAENGAVARAGDLDVAGRLARVVDRHQVLAAVLGPFHRAAAMPRSEGNKKILRVKLAARAKAAANVVFHHVDCVFGQTHLLGEDAPVGEQHLGGTGDGQAATRGVPFGQHAARLHRQRGMPLCAEALAPRVGRGVEGRVGVAEHRAKFHRNVAALIFKQQCVAVERAFPI